MRTAWRESDEDKSVTAPMSLIISAFAPVKDIRQTVTPRLRTDRGASSLLLIDLGRGKHRLGGSCLAQVYNQLGNQPADLDDAQLIKAFFDTIQSLLEQQLLIAYHDRSDGGLFVTLMEMAFAGHCGLDIDISGLAADGVAALFCEELGAVLQVSDSQRELVVSLLKDAGLEDCIHWLGRPRDDDQITITASGFQLRNTRLHYQQLWSETSYRIQALRDNPDCAQQEYDSLAQDNPGLSAALTYDPAEDIAAPYINLGERPKAAILREQGVNGQYEMAAAFDRAGFDAVDVHMSDILTGRIELSDFKLLAACGGFSYGDVLGAGEGWAKTILFNERARDQFQQYFQRSDTLSLGVCNGCQMMSNLRELIPGADHWPRFVRNLSEQYEARVALVQVQQSPSLLLSDMVGSHMPVAVAHGEGRAEFVDEVHLDTLNLSGRVALRYVDNNLSITQAYPANPNGSPLGITAVTTADGRVTIMMPHPERVFRTVQNSWHPDDWGEDGAWMRLFRNARCWID